MKRKSLLYFAMIAILLIFAAGFMGCDTGSDTGTETPTATPTTPPTGNGTLSGTVIDEAGAPIVGATVGLDLYENPTATPTGEPTSYPYSENELEGTTTDDNGQFDFSNLATGVQYVITITYEGRVTLTPIVVISDETQALTFEITMPLGDGTASFTLPQPSTLNNPTMTGRTVDLSWVHRDKGTVYEGYYLYRSLTPDVTANDTLLTTNTLYGSTTYTDTLPSTGGGFYYRLFESYVISDYSVRIILSSNEVAVYLDEYIFGQKWYSSEGDDPFMIYPVGLGIYEADGHKTVFITDNISYYQDPQYMFTITDDGALTPFYQNVPPPPADQTDSKNGIFSFTGVNGTTVDSEGLGYIVGNVNNTAFLIIGDLDGTLVSMYEIDGYEDWIDVAVTVATDGTRTIYITDLYDEDVDVFEWNPTTPEVFTLVDIWYYTKLGGAPFGIAVDATGNVYVTTFNDYLFPLEPPVGNVKKFDPDGNLLMTISGSTDEDSNMGLPLGLDVDAEGNIYVGDTNGLYDIYPSGGPVSRILKFDAAGNFLTQFGSYTEPTSITANKIFMPTPAPDGTMNMPTGVVVDSNQSVYVADPGTSTVQRFDLTEQN